MKFADIIVRPERGLLALVAAQVAFWTLAPALSHSAPPLDVVEMYAWGREHVVATFKHPNLPGLVLEPTRWLFGAGWPAYLISQIFVAITFWAVFALGRELMDGARSLAGVLLLTGVYFFSWVTPEFNHNVAQMPLWALVMLFLWRAAAHDKWMDWLWLGVFAGLSLWAKYSSGILLIVAAAWMMWDGRARSRILSPGPWIAFAAFLVTAAPQAIWLLAHDFQPFAYAARRAGSGEWHAPLEFLLTVVLDHLPMAILLVSAGFFGKPAIDPPARPDRRAMRYLLLLGLGPALLTAAGAAVGGAGLRASWGAPMAALSGLLVVALIGDKFSAQRLKRLVIGAVAMIVVVSGLYFAHMRYGVMLTGKPLRGNWQQAEISASLQETWRQATGGAPLRIVVGDIWTAGLIGLEDSAPPSVLINGDFSTSPWVTPDELARYGALVVWSGDQPPALAEFVRGLPQNQRTYRAAGARAGARDVTIHYAMVPPSGPGEAEER